MRCGFATGQGHPSSGIVVEGPVLFHLVHDFLHRHRFPDDLQRIVQTGVHALHAEIATVTDDLVVGRLLELCLLRRYGREDGVPRAGLEAGPTLDAKPPLPVQLRMGGDRFRVVAPVAPHHAALQIDVRPETGPIVHRESLDVCDQNTVSHVPS